MGTVENNRLQEWCIAITPDTEALLLGLEPAFRGALHTNERDDLSDLSDDKLVATFLGWDMRNQSVGFIDASLYVWAEFSARARLANGQNAHKDTFIKRRIAARGTEPRDGNALTGHGIDTNTVHLLTRRVREFEVYLEKFARIPFRQLVFEAHEATLLELAEVPDQVILDAAMYFYVASFERNPHRSFPMSVVDEIHARALKRQVFSLQIHNSQVFSSNITDIHSPAGVLTVPQEVMPPKLRPRDRLAFTRARHINYNDPFWTDERIFEALDLGL